MAKLDKKEKTILKSYEKGEWRSIKNLKPELKKYKKYASATLRTAISYDNDTVMIRLCS